MRIVLSLLVFLFFPLSVMAAGSLYQIDPAQTKVKFSVKMCEADILIGEFHKVQGSIFFDEANPEKSHAEITIDLKDITYNRDYHKEDPIAEIIAGEKILEVEKYPAITFKSTRIEKTGSFTGMMTGELTIKGVTKPFTMEITFHEETGMTVNGRELAAFSSYGTFKRSEFGLTYGLDRIGIRKMGDEVMVLVSTAATRQNSGQ